VQERNRFANRVQKVLEDTNIKLSSVATDIQGVSAQAILRALLAGQSDVKALTELAKDGYVISKLNWNEPSRARSASTIAGYWPNC